MPQPIQNAHDFARAVSHLEELDFAQHPLTSEEEALREVLAALIEAYDDSHFPETDDPNLHNFAL